MRTRVLSAVQTFPRPSPTLTTAGSLLVEGKLNGLETAGKPLQPQANANDQRAQGLGQGSLVPTKRNYEMAFDLLESASHSLAVFQQRQRQMEIALTEAARQCKLARSASEGAEAKAREWQSLANMIKTQLKDTEAQLAAMQRRAEIAEADFAREKARADNAELRAFSESTMSTLFHDKILSTFGTGSRAYPALVAIAEGSEFHVDET